MGALALGPALEFERSDAGRRLRLVLAEVIDILAEIHRAKEQDMKVRTHYESTKVK